jgi:hypothetical protein
MMMIKIMSQKHYDADIAAARREGAEQIKSVVQFMLDKYNGQDYPATRHTEGAYILRQQLNVLEETMVFVDSDMRKLA